MITFEAIDAASPGKSLAAALLAFERKHDVHLTLHDCRGIFYHADGTPFFPGRYMHIHPYCITGRFETPGWNRRCHEECMLRAEAAADRLRRPFLHSCWKGVTELIVPLERNGSLALLLYAGAFRTPGTELPEELPEPLRQLYAGLPLPGENLGNELALELQLFGQGLLHYADLCRNRTGAPQERSNQIRRFLEDHAHEEAGLAELAEALHLSVTYTCHLVKYHFGKPFHTLLREERIRRACNLLHSTELPLKAVAAAVGFRNEFYFNRLFTRVCGIPPGEFRKSGRNQPGAGWPFA